MLQFPYLQEECNKTCTYNHRTIWKIKWDHLWEALNTGPGIMTVQIHNDYSELGSMPNLKTVRPGLFNSSQNLQHINIHGKVTPHSFPPNHKAFTAETEDTRSTAISPLHLKTLVRRLGRLPITWLLFFWLQSYILLWNSILHPLPLVIVFLFFQYLSPKRFGEVPVIQSFIPWTKIDPSNSYRPAPF